MESNKFKTLEEIKKLYPDNEDFIKWVFLLHGVICGETGLDNVKLQPEYAMASFCKGMSPHQCYQQIIQKPVTGDDILEKENFMDNELLPFSITKRSDDPMALRISAGGTDQLRYLVYRGELTEIRRILVAALHVVDMKLNN